MMSRRQFHKIVYDYYHAHRRDLPWRRSVTPYRVVVSEIMLQQTQVDRVVPKYRAFIKLFPSWRVLALATPVDVLRSWQGLGYNRRALALHAMAQQIVGRYHGRLPADPDELVLFPGIGPHTAASICAFAFDQPVVFIETNIRSVFIHHFFGDRTGIDDRELYSIVERMLDRDQPREWYSALMDYGTMLKRQLSNPSRRSKHHVPQSRFEGSYRQLRGVVIRQLLTQPAGLSLIGLRRLTGESGAGRLATVVQALEKEGFITRAGRTYRIKPK